MVPYFPGKNPSGIAGYEDTKTCCTPRHGKRKVAPQ
jgi:hypothetical protein